MNSHRSNGGRKVAILLVSLVMAALIAMHVMLQSRSRNTGLLTEVVFWSLLGSLTHILLSLIPGNDVGTHTLLKKPSIWLLQIALGPLLALALFYVYEEETFENSFILLSFIAGLFSRSLLLLFRGILPDTEQKIAVASSGDQITFSTADAEEPYGLLPHCSVTVFLALDDAGLFFDEKKEIQQHGFDGASVSVQLNGTGDVINAIKTGAGKNLCFLADDIEQGRHIVRAMLSLRMQDKSILNLFGEQEFTVSEDTAQLILAMKKLEA